MVISLLVSIAAILMVFSIIPQVLKIKKTQNVSNISKATYYMLLAASLLLLIYSFIIMNVVMLVSFFIMAASSALVLRQISQYTIKI